MKQVDQKKRQQQLDFIAASGIDMKKATEQDREKIAVPRETSVTKMGNVRVKRENGQWYQKCAFGWRAIGSLNELILDEGGDHG